MNNFQAIEIIDNDTIRVKPRWKYIQKNGAAFMGDKIKIRGLNGSMNNPVLRERLTKLLITSEKEINCSAPELVYSENDQDAIVSCSIYLSQTNILYYFPEFVYKD